VREEALGHLAAGGGAVKLAMIMALITQAFRYAYEPFVFAAAKKGESTDNRTTYALTMKYFLIFTLFAFLMVIAYIDLFKHMMGRDYWDGLKTVAIVMVGEIIKGVYFNLSFWYKLTDRTIWGAWFSGAGCLVLVACNLLFVPRFGSLACAWAGGGGCLFCPAAPWCPERAAFVAEAVGLDALTGGTADPVDYSPAVLAKAMGHVEAVEGWCKAVRREALRQAGTDEGLPGWHLKPGRARRSVTEEAAQALVDFGVLSEDEAFTRSPATLSKLEKAVGGRKALDAAVGDLLKLSTSAPALAKDE